MKSVGIDGYDIYVLGDFVTEVQCNSLESHGIFRLHSS